MSDLSQLDTDKNTPPIGEVLKARREEYKLSIADVSQQLCIRSVFLKALEDGKIEELPGIAYASGFLRTYADFLQLDSDKLVAQFKRDNQKNTEKLKLLFPAPVPQSGVPAGAMIFFSLVIIVGAYIGWYKMSDHHQSPSETIPPAPVQTDQKAGVTQQLSPQVASIMPSDHPAPLPDDSNHSSGKTVDSASVNAAPTTKGEITSQSTIAPMDSMQQPTQHLPPQQQAVSNADQSLSQQKVEDQPLLLKAIAPSWLQIKDKDGKVLIKKVLKTDETWTFPSGGDEVTMTIGNAGAVILKKGDLESAPLGKKGRALRRFKVDSAKADHLLHPDQADKTKPAQSETEALSEHGDTNSKSNLNAKPTVNPSAEHDSSADTLNARQLNH